jgi:putative toxin-antitoxin system antitoxin component (TIGR02293 family)
VEFQTGEWGPAPKQGRSKNRSTDSVSVREVLPDNPPSEPSKELSFMTPFTSFIEEAPATPVAPEEPEPFSAPESPVAVEEPEQFFASAPPVAVEEPEQFFPPEPSVRPELPEEFFAPAPLVRPEPPIYAMFLKDPLSSEGLAPFSSEISFESESIGESIKVEAASPAAEPAVKIDPPKSRGSNYPAETDAPKGKATGYPGGGEAFRSKTPGYPAGSGLPKGKASGFARGGRAFSSKTLEYSGESDTPKSKAAGYPAGNDAFRRKSTGSSVQTEPLREKQSSLPAEHESPHTEESSHTKLEMFASYSGFAVEELLEAVIDPGTEKNSRPLHAPLTMEETDRLARVARIYEVAVKVYGDSEDGRKWLTGKKHRFDGMTALSMLRTEAGERAVRQFLIQIDEGMFV